MSDDYKQRTDEMLARVRAAVQLRDRCVQAAVDHAKYLGFDLSVVQARVAYDVMAPLIREAQQ